MTWFEIVAHRGVPMDAPENTIPAFMKAITLGTESIELDVRLTKDQIPFVFHYFYLDEITNFSGPIFNYTYQQLSRARFGSDDDQGGDPFEIPTFREVLEVIGGQIGLEIKIQCSRCTINRASVKWSIYVPLLDSTVSAVPVQRRQCVYGSLYTSPR